VGLQGEEDRDSEEYKVMMETFRRSVRGKAVVGKSVKKERGLDHHNNGTDYGLLCLSGTAESWTHT
jgi:hypothetical protein